MSPVSSHSHQDEVSPHTQTESQEAEEHDSTMSSPTSLGSPKQPDQTLSVQAQEDQSTESSHTQAGSSSQPDQTISTEAEGHNPVGDADGKSNEAKTKRSRANFDKPINLPDEKSDLTEAQINRIIRQGPSIRKRYGKYFYGTGCIMPRFYHLLFAKLPSGEFVFPEAIMKSNVTSLPAALASFERHRSMGVTTTITRWGPGCKPATRATPSKRPATENSQDQPSSPKKAKESKSAARRHGDNNAAKTSRAQANPEVDTASVADTSLDIEVREWFTKCEDNDQDTPVHANLLQFLAWFDGQLVVLQYGLVGAISMGCNRYNELLKEILKRLSRVYSTYKKLVAHLEDEVATELE
ncbi:hypothetical protein N7492_005823 [Penicillium capsulatum]|uniref:Uncharacterized protein n=1 Tax=Penicillium capsulatum TaxID=69766 RepID=A0A9W9LSA9_9EURO|nr:hypothetical protein N7492_005823 [Penicillium capsulatum]KAJ6135077.1 hypothetical protein N7512_000237 [Penicillium capsulatum]